MAGLAGLAGLVACGSPSVDGERAAELFERVTLATGGVHGLSGLAVDADGALWTVAERGAVAFRIVLDGERGPVVAAYPVDGVPAGEDLEAVAVLPGGALAVGTEGRTAGVARVFRLRGRDGRWQVDGPPLELGGDEAGVAIGANHGAEALCAVGDRLVVALETAGRDARGRWAPLVIVEPDGRRTGHRARLRTATGKLSGLDCWADGARARALAIERHFEVTQLVAFDLPPPGAGPADLDAELVLDLGPVLRGALNLEGIVRLPDGRPVAVVDNQYGRITGPSELLVFRSPVR